MIVARVIRYFITQFYLLLSLLSRRKPARDFKFASHHCRIATIDREIYIFENNKFLRPLHVVKKMEQRWPRAFGFDRSENGLMIRGRLTCSDRRIFNQDIVFVRDFLDLIKQRRGF